MTCSLPRTLTVAAVGLLALLAAPVRGQDPPPAPAAPTADFEDFAEISLDDLLNTEVQVTMRHTALRQADAPAVLTVVTREEIRAMGARDLTDVLLRVPGFDFGVDIQSVVSAGFRGLWGNEGKILVLLDGHEMHDLSYLNTLFLNRYSLDWIERIEIIRGPGSVIYGGAAEVAVVSIVTRSADKLHGVDGSLRYGQYVSGEQVGVDSYGRRTASLSYGQRFGGADGPSVKIDLFAGQGQISNRDYRDPYYALGEDRDAHVYNMAGASSVDPLMINAAADFRGLEVHYLFELYRTNGRDAYVELFPVVVPNNFLTSSLWAAYDLRLGDTVHLTPRLAWLWQKPWLNLEEDQRELDQYWNPTVQQVKPSLSLTWNITPDIELLAGGEAQYDHSNDPDYGYPDPADPEQTVYDIGFWNVAGFVQGLWNTPWVNLSAGARGEWHSASGLSFVPRVAATRRFDRFHVKALISGAHRVPSVEVLGMNPDLHPERTLVLELEVGARVTDNVFVSANAFDISVQDAIVYVYAEDDAESGYKNRGSTGSRGFEVTGRAQSGPAFVQASFTYYTAAGTDLFGNPKNDIAAYMVPDNDQVLLGFAPMKLTLYGELQPREGYHLGVSAVLLAGERYAYDRYQRAAGAAGYVGVTDRHLQDMGPLLLLDAHLQVDELFLPGLYGRVGAFNLLDARQQYIQPYDGDHAPLPGPPMEVLLTLGYRLGL